MAANRFGEDYQQAMVNSRRELDNLIPQQRFISTKKDESEKVLIRKLKRQWKQDLAAMVNMPFFKGNFPNIEKSFKQHFQKRLIRLEDLSNFNYNLN